MQTLLYHTQGVVTTITLNRPDKHNALNPAMIAELTQCFEDAAQDQKTRVIVLKGNGKSFCAGADLHYMKEIAAFGLKENIADGLKLATLFDTIYNCPKPVLACVHGSVVGGANGLTAACDIVLAEESTVFAFSEVKLGITPATIAPYVIRRCGEAAARHLMLTGRYFSAKEGLRLHLVTATASASDENFVNLCDDYVNMLSNNAPGALEACKKLISDIALSNASTTSLMNYTAQSIAERRASAEGQEGIQAFFDKRKPSWTLNPEPDDQ